MRQKKSRSVISRVVRIALTVLAVFLGSIVVQLIVNLGIKAPPQRPLEPIDAGGAERLLYWYDLAATGRPLPEGIELHETFVNAELQGSFDYINGRYDCADFRMNSLMRLYLGFGDQLPGSTKQAIRQVIVDFKYWMDQGGSDSMCYWSENHQILFAVSEYLAGQTFPDEVFSVDGKTGTEHKAMARSRILAWMEQRFLYGFTEWYSNNYYPEDVGPMANFIQFARDPEMVNRMKMVMDLLWHDMASQSFRYQGLDSAGQDRLYYIFVPSAGRAYSDNRVSDDLGNRMRPFIDFVLQPEKTRHLEDGWYYSMNGFFNCFRQMIEARDAEGRPFYRVPEVITEIFNDNAPERIRTSSQSLAVEELAEEGLLGQSDAQIMMQFGMEAFTNPPVIGNTISYLAANNMFTNDFLNDFKLVNLWPLRAFGLLDELSTVLRPAPDGVAIERSNVYTYITDYYSMHTAQGHQPGEYADQQAVSSINLSNYLSVFTTQPAKIPRRSGTPTYWTGNGRQPWSVQEKNVLMELYQPPEKAGFMEAMVMPELTHVYFPIQHFDEIDTSRLAEGMIFGRTSQTYIAIRSAHALHFVPFAESAKEDD
ncbi:MAG: hypothetical protein KKI09_14530, partial [Spirochaetes bacterium]|nr:hypothetical protein [Spirochaetota bacterium]MBU0956640.1 hypothetical protein [Spirochaetota bacterium]